MSAIVAAAGVEDYTFLWWDIRPHPKLGTLEVRAMDAQARLGSVCGLAALVHGLVMAAAEPESDMPEPPREVLVESSFRAGRDGLDATIWDDGGLRPLRELATAAIERARPYAREVGADAALEEVERILREGNGAQRMRTAHAEGGMARVLERLVAESAEPLEVR
jgi:carboxylate-amine ligase